MNTSIIIRPAQVADAQDMAEVVRGSFHPDLLRLSIYGCTGIADFVAEQIAARDLGCDTMYCVACKGREVIGLAEIRQAPTEIFLSCISVLPAYRSGGVGGRLLEAAIREAGGAERTRLGLDVVGSDLAARTWYDRLGFQPEFSGQWWSIPLDESENAALALLSGYPQARACYQRFGFSEFTLRTVRGDYRIGMLNRDWFRITQPEALSDPGVWSTLRKLDSSRRALAVVPEVQAPSVAVSGAEVLITYSRLWVDTARLAWRLSGIDDGYEGTVPPRIRA